MFVNKKGNVMSDDTLFTVRELAKYLRMKPVTIYKHASQGKIPAFKVGSHWRFKKATVDNWISEQENKVKVLI